MARVEQSPVPIQAWLDAENAVIGSLLLDERLAAPILATVDASDFGNKDNRRIYQAARALLQEGSPVDPVTIRGKLGPEVEQRLVQLMQITPTAANWREYAAIMHESATLSRVQSLAQELTQTVNLEDTREKIAALTDLVATGKHLEAWTMEDAFRHFMEAQAAEKKRDYIGYGIREIDEGTYTERGDVVVIGGEPSAGKTALALVLAYHMAKKYRVGFFSLETGPRKLTDRLVSSALGIDFNTIKRQKMEEADFEKAAAGGSEFTARRLTLLRSSGLTASQIQSISRSYGFEIIFVDYVQLITPEGDPRAGMTQAVAAISRSLHTFAQSSNTLVVELAQLSRPQKQGGWREPTMHDLKETGQLEQDADAVMLLYRPKPGGDFDPDKTRVLKIAKQKEGRLGKWPLAFDGAHQSFAPLAGPDGRAIMRQMSDKARAVKAARRGQVQGQVEFREIPDPGNLPL